MTCWKEMDRERGLRQRFCFSASRSSYIPEGGKWSCWEELLSRGGLILEQRQAGDREVVTESWAADTTCHLQKEADGPMKLSGHQFKKRNEWVTLKPEPVKMPWSPTDLNAKRRKIEVCKFYSETLSIDVNILLKDSRWAWASWPRLSLILCLAI